VKEFPMPAEAKVFWEHYTFTELATLSKRDPTHYDQLRREHAFRRDRGWLGMDAAEIATIMARYPMDSAHHRAYARNLILRATIAGPPGKCRDCRKALPQRTARGRCLDCQYSAGGPEAA
jgi:hypothetical protein